MDQSGARSMRMKHSKRAVFKNVHSWLRPIAKTLNAEISILNVLKNKNKYFSLKMLQNPIDIFCHLFPQTVWVWWLLSRGRTYRWDIETLKKSTFCSSFFLPAEYYSFGLQSLHRHDRCKTVITANYYYGRGLLLFKPITSFLFIFTTVLYETIEHSRHILSFFKTNY